MNKNKIKLLLGILIPVIIFHILIMVKIIPYDIVWGGRLTNDSEMYVFETISILINVFLSWILLMKGNFTKFKFPILVINIILWIFVALFILNTIGNLFAKTTFEQCLAILTLILVLVLGSILLQKDAKRN